MTTQEQAFINGFVKRANEYGFSNNEALALLKTSETGYIPYREAHKQTLDSAVNTTKDIGQKGLALGRRAGEALFGGAETLSNKMNQFANYIIKDNPNAGLSYNAPRVRIPIPNYAGNIASDPGYLNINDQEMTTGPIISAAKNIGNSLTGAVKGVGKGINTLAQEMSKNQNTLNSPGFVANYKIPAAPAASLAKSR
jgi:hypothetical protein